MNGLGVEVSGLDDRTSKRVVSAGSATRGVLAARRRRCDCSGPMPIAAPDLITPHICLNKRLTHVTLDGRRSYQVRCRDWHRADRKSTRLNSSHEWISYAVFCLEKKKSEVRGT